MFKKRSLIFLCIIFIHLLKPQPADAQAPTSKIFESGNTICFLGDSITHGGQFHEFLQLFYATRFPSLKLTFYNCGIAGDNAEGMHYRFKDDVLVHHPSHVFLMTGMNDVIRTLYFEGKASDEVIRKRKNALSEYKQNTNILAKKIKASGITPIYLTPSIYDQYSKIERANNKGCNDALIACSEQIKSIANEYNTAVVDLNTQMKNIMDRELQNDSLFTIVGKDRVHPETTGHFIMFHEILSTIESSSVVAKVSIDLNQKNRIKTENSCVDELHVSSDKISFNCLENSLPFPTNNAMNKAISLLPFEKNFNQEILQVIGLEDGDYAFFIQDKLITTYSAEQLNKGVNLSTESNTPQYKQAQEIMALCEEYRKTGYQLRAVPFMVFKYLRDYTGPNNVPSTQIHLEKKLKKMKGAAFYKYIKKSMQDYYEVLPKQDSLNNRLKKIAKEIYRKNKSTKRSWSIVKNE